MKGVSPCRSFVRCLHFQKLKTRARNVFQNHPFCFSSGALFLNTEFIARALIEFKHTHAHGNGGSLHAQMIKLGLCYDVFIANNLLSMYSSFNCSNDAAKLFDEMSERNVISWTTMISSYIQAGNPDEALRIFVQMLDIGLEEPNCYTFSAALKACALIGDLDMGKLVHVHIETFSLKSDTALMNSIIDMYIKCKSLVEARKVFDRTFPLNSISWNTMISGYCHAGQMNEAENLFSKIPIPDSVSFNTMVMGFAKNEPPKALYYVNLMHKQHLKLDFFTLPCALKICGNLGEFSMGLLLHSYIIKRGCEGGLYMGSSLIDMYGNCGHLDAAVMFFDECFNYKWPIVDRLPLLNSMLSAYVNNGYDKCALYCLSKIHSSELRLNAFALSSALKACIHLNVVRVGLQVHGLIITEGYHVDQVVGSILVDFYAKCGKLEDAAKTFFRLPQKDLVAWTGLIASCVQKGMNQFALTVFKDMMVLQSQIDHFIVSIILKACAALSLLQSCEQLHALCIKGGFEMEGVIVTSLIDAYSKCGDIENAVRLFWASTHKDTVSWTGIIVGCGNNGRTDEAIQLFHLMLDSGEKPNEVTFLGVLSACRHAGLVSNASSIFKVMEQKYGLMPCLEHYCCMVDILGRAGLFDEALQLILGMPFKPDEKIWNSLLGSSMMHQNVDVGRLALSRLQVYSKKDASGLVSLSNVYAGKNLWGCSNELREIARSANFKEPGISWTEARG